MKWVVHCKRSPYDVYIGRPGLYGNMFSHIPGKGDFQTSSREEAIQRYEEHLLQLSEGDLRIFLEPLCGKILGCWCSPKSCHGDVLRKHIVRLFGEGS